MLKCFSLKELRFLYRNTPTGLTFGCSLCLTSGFSSSCISWFLKRFIFQTLEHKDMECWSYTASGTLTQLWLNLKSLDITPQVSRTCTL
ncbi:Hypothetical predicted protein [Scomber scombrus]|uniref:Uncharacterized protein n=1 Tax=Scomber scombrus TaxID=13677 RepID=A0AAV1NLB1_SCOSC